MGTPQDTDGRTWLDVPFAQKDTAQRAGARWDRKHRRWYAPPGRGEALQRWSARGDLPAVLPGEDRTYGGQMLYVDAVPTSCWFTNVRSCVDATDWDRLRRMIYDRAGHRCEVCGVTPDRARKEWLEAHERWQYDMSGPVPVQRLRRLIALCSDCHTVTHFGYAEMRGLQSRARAHLAKVNRWSPSDVELHLEGTAEDWYARDQIRWELDLTLLTGAGVSVAPPPSRDSRAGAAYL